MAGICEGSPAFWPSVTKTSRLGDREDVVDFLSDLYKQKLDSRSVSRYLVSLRSFFKYALMEELVRVDPTENLESAKIRQRLPTYLRQEEMNRLMEGSEYATPVGSARSGELEVFRRVHADQFLHQGVLEKLRSETRYRETDLPVQFLLIEIGKEVDDIFTVHRVDLVFVTLGQKAGEPSQIPAISENGVLGQTLSTRR